MIGWEVGMEGVGARKDTNIVVGHVSESLARDTRILDKS